MLLPLKLAALLAIVAALFIIPARFIVRQNSFFGSKILETLQTCSQDSDCLYFESQCCDCEHGGRQIPLNRKNRLVYTLIIKDICLFHHQEECPEEVNCFETEPACEKSYCRVSKKVEEPDWF